MRGWPLSALVLAACFFSCCFAQAPPAPPQSAAPGDSLPPPSNDYPLGPDSQPNPASPAGQTFQFELTESKIFPGTTRTIVVYVPAAYRPEKPACVYIGLDGLGFHASTVFDNLIARHAVPVTIGIGVAPGTVASTSPPDNPRFDRSFEFDSRSPLLARFLLEEVIPAVEQHSAPDGRPIRLSSDPNDRAIGGGSTGAIAAFTVAWERPDAFRRVFSAIGTYVGMRGGEQYYVLVRKTEPKPLRIFMQDGMHDEWPGGPEMGDWWMSNLTMERALEFAGYDVRHVWGVGTHNGNQASAIFPQAMQWLWRDWPAPIQARPSGNPVLEKILEPSQDWQVEDGSCAAQVAVNAQGQLRCGSARELAAFVFQGGARRQVTLAARLNLSWLTVRSNGDAYALTPDELWLIRPDGTMQMLDHGLRGAAGVALSPDGLWLFVAQSLSSSGISYRVRADGTVDARAPFYDFYVPATAGDSGASQIAMDTTGLAYVATRMGVQVFDRNGRVAAILPLPGNAEATGLCFGGADFSTLYVAAGGRIYRRKLRAVGTPPWAPPHKLPPWGAG